MVGAHAGVIVFANLPTHIHSINFKNDYSNYLWSFEPSWFQENLEKICLRMTNLWYKRKHQLLFIEMGHIRLKRREIIVYPIQCKRFIIDLVKMLLIQRIWNLKAPNNLLSNKPQCGLKDEDSRCIQDLVSSIGNPLITILI